ncbi:MAG: dTDP-4-amino-4,6-dideoxygalactose transaminase [Bacillota bacterium]|nr:dTDP-4-amino-4,6-dideoxygalactose transaminase [Bacillota bacterium]
MIPFNKPCFLGKEIEYIKKSIETGKISGNGEFSKRVSGLMEKEFSSHKIFLTPSCTDGLEMAALVCDIKEGDEVIMPSFTFVSTANAFVLRGAKIVFVDINPETMNIDENKIEEAISEKTKALVPMHYGGVSCNMDKIMDLAKRYGLMVIEDAAQGVMAKYKDKYLGTIGDIGCFSFHETKNYTSAGEGGAVSINNIKLIEKAEIIWEKGTNRKMFFKGEVDKYSWIDKGSSYLMADTNAAYLLFQMENRKKINNKRLYLWEKYHKELKELQKDNFIKLPKIPDYANHNGHIYFIKVENNVIRRELIGHLKENDILTVFHYAPLHSSPAGKKYGIFHGEDIHTLLESERLLRLPMYYDLKENEVEFICSKIKEFFENNKHNKLRN